MSFSTFWDPSTVGTTTQRSDATSTFFAGTVTGAFSAVLGGPMAAGTPGGTNTVGSDVSTIVNGANNNINVIGPGINGIFNTIVNGQNNTLDGSHTSIFGGNTNNISSGGLPTVIHNTIVGGLNNNMNGGSFMFMGSGENNSMFSNSIYSGLVHGCANSMFSSCYSMLVGGGDNQVCQGAYNSLLGGHQNTVGSNSNISALVGGEGNVVLGLASFVGGGQNNVLSNVAGANHSFLGGGQNNVLSSNESFIGSGNSNNINQFADGGVIVGGAGNSIFGALGFSSQQNFVGGGTGNST